MTPNPAKPSTKPSHAKVTAHGQYGIAGPVVQHRLQWAIAAAVVATVACIGLRLLMIGVEWCLTQNAGMLPNAAATLGPWRRVLTPVVGALLAIAALQLAAHLNPGKRFVEYIEAYHFEYGRIPFLVTLGRTISAVFSVASGAAIGREGSMIQFAASVVSLLGELRLPGARFARWLGQDVATRKHLLACGVAAAVGSVYQTPVGGAFFATEIVMGAGQTFSLDTLLALLVASGLGTALTRIAMEAMGIHPAPLFPVSPAAFSHPEQAWILLLPALLLAVLIGVASPGYHWLLKSLKKAKTLPLALAWGGLAVGLLSLWRVETWGNGDVALTEVLQGTPTLRAALAVMVARLAATTICVGTGTVGGVFTPTLYTGGAMGLLFGLAAGHWLHESASLFALIGMGCLLAAVSRAPWMAFFMTLELSGAIFMPMALAREGAQLVIIALCCFVAWKVARRVSNESLYAIATPVPIEPHREPEYMI